MPQDAYTLRHISKELAREFVGGKISRINQPEKDWLSLLIYTLNGTVKLDICLSAKYCRISAAEKREVPNPKVAPNFCMLLRKHLQNAQITAISQIGFERVIAFDLKCFSEFETTDMRLYLEIMGKYSNAVLTKDGIIVGAMKVASLENNAKRITMSGARYALPEKQDKADPFDRRALNALFEGGHGDAAKFIADRVAGIALTTAADMVAEYGEDITADEVYEYVTGGEPSPCVTLAGGKPADFKARCAGGDKISYPTLLGAQAAYYDHCVGERLFADKKRKLASALSSSLKKTEKWLGQIESKLAECASMEDVKLKGELITSNIYAVRRGDRTLEAVNYYDPECRTVKIELDTRLTPAQNAQKYYKKYAKLKRTATALGEQKAELSEKLFYLNSIEVALNSSEDMPDLTGIEQELVSLSLLPDEGNKKGKKAKDAPLPFRQYECDGFEILCGRNNVQNDRLVRSLSDDDFWLHAKAYHSSHVAIIAGGRQPTDRAIKFAAEVCAYYSEARQSDKTAIDYTRRKFVKKPSGANAGFVTYTQQKTILVTPDAHAGERNEI